MSGLRSVTLGTSDLSKTNKLFKDILGLNVASKNQALRFGDADLSQVHEYILLKCQILNMKINISLVLV